jgi:hypothetical protein
MDVPEAQTTNSPARRRRKPAYVPEDPFLTASEAAAERGQGVSTFWRDVAAGRIAPPIYVSPRCPRWPRSTIRRNSPPTSTAE